MEDIVLEDRAFCYWCLVQDNLSIKAKRKTMTTYICRNCRNKQAKQYKQTLTYHMPPKKTKEIGWSDKWLKQSEESLERISKRGVNYGTSN